MRKWTSILLMTSALLMIVAVKRAEALPERVTVQTVRYACIISPNWWGHVEGEWITDCNGNTTGWGWEPGHGCTETEVTYGDWCPSGGGGGGGGGPENQN
jgi:hypothetical protein